MVTNERGSLNIFDELFKKEFAWLVDDAVELWLFQHC